MRRLLLLACAVVFLDVTFFSVLTPLLPSYQSDHHLSDGGAGLLAGSFAAGALFFAIPAGWLVASAGARKTVIVGLVAIGICSPLFGFAEQIVVLDLLRFLQGGAGALMWSGAIAWVVVASPTAQRGQMIGIVIAAAVTGELLGAPLGAIAHAVGTEIVFSTVFFAAAVLIVLAMAIPGPADVESQPLAEAWRRIRRSDVPSGLLMLAAPSVAFGLAVVIGPLHMDKLGASPFLIAAAFASGSVIEAVIGPVIGRVSDRVGRTLPYLVGVAAMAVAVIGLGAFGVLPLMFVTVMVMAFGAGLAFTPASTLVTDHATAAGVNQGYASGTSNMAWGGGQMLGAIGGGALAAVSGYLLPCLIAALLLVAVGIVARSLGIGPPVISGQQPEPAPGEQR
ncbi:MAG: MFS transporter [Solirubrobacterales bacterium]|nr:MFS transporter [Solirubrobacterales bacterium]MCB0860609.1 MFS transporter [Solirubrobacterales bacterium]HRV59979.1 MFS transporter [Solirubrobacterales bacterium]